MIVHIIMDNNDYIWSLKGEKYNICHKYWRKVFRCKREFDFPLFLAFEIMFKCNLRYIICIYFSQGKSKYGYKEIMEECSKYFWYFRPSIGMRYLMNNRLALHHKKFRKLSCKLRELHGIASALDVSK